MKTISRYLMTLALLLTAVTGAWAEEKMVTINSSTMSSGAVTATGFKMMFGRLYVNEDPATITTSEGVITRLVIKKGNLYENNFTEANVGVTPGTITYGSNEITVTDINAESVTLSRKGGQNWCPSSVDVYYGAVGPEVTTNAAEEGATFTEASFEMPTYDVDVDYELVRDMSVQMTTEIGDGNDGYRIRLQKNEQTGKYEPAEMTAQQMKELVKVHDALENKDLTFGVLGANCIVNIYAANENNEATGDPIAFADLTPGRYIAKAVAATGSAYEGETGMSNIFELYEGYQVVIPAGEYVTYYKDEAVRLDEKDKNDIELCTITAVEDGKAVLSDNFDAMKANTPFLLKNTTTEEKTILLIPCNEPDLAVTVAEEFKGTEGACEFSEALMATGDFYVCNGKEFIKVRGAGTLAANRAYLKVDGTKTAPASIPFRRSIGGEGEGTTGIDAIDNAANNDANATWYDLNGRKLNGKPAQKGVYIKNGKKIIVP